MVDLSNFGSIQTTEIKDISSLGASCKGRKMYWNTQILSVFRPELLSIFPEQLIIQTSYDLLDEKSWYSCVPFSLRFSLCTVKEQLTAYNSVAKFLWSYLCRIEYLAIAGNKVRRRVKVDMFNPQSNNTMPTVLRLFLVFCGWVLS